MAEQAGPEFSDKELLAQAAGNWRSFFFATIEYLRKQGLSPEDYMQWLGERLAPGWEGSRGDMEQIAYFTALNPVALWAELREYEVSDDQATIQIVIPEIPSDVSREDVDLVNEVYRPIMAFLNLRYEWDREGDVTTFRLRKKEEDQQQQ